jgi:hypothetical protein
MRFFYHFLATELGMTVRELLSRIGADEINDWMAYYQIRQDLGKGPGADEPTDFRKNFEAFVNGNSRR